MVQLTSSLNLLLLGNSIVTIGLILNQNESSKDANITANRNSTSATNPLETFTWGCFLVQLILLLMKTKITDF